MTSPVDVPSEFEALDFTQGLRRQLITQLISPTPIVSPDVKLPDDPSERELLVKLIDGTDRQALGRLRVKTDTNSAGAMADMATNVAAIANKIFDGIGDNDPHRSATPVKRDLGLPNALVDEFTVVPGQTEISPKEQTYDTFIASPPEEK